MSRQRKSNVETEIVRLEQKHEQLAELVATMDRRPHLPSTDQLQLNQLKREKLAMKDALSMLKRN